MHLNISPIFQLKPFPVTMPLNKNYKKERCLCKSQKQAQAVGNIVIKRGFQASIFNPVLLFCPS